MYKKIKQKKKIKSGIYCIYNTANNKRYIGSTIHFKNREWNHFDQLKKGTHINQHLQSSFNKYKEDNFLFCVLEYVENKEELLSIEQYYIDMFFGKDCYNILPIAGSPLGRKMTKKTRDKLKSIWESLSRPVIQITKNGEFIAKYSSISEASRVTGFVMPSINACCTKRGLNIKKSVGGFVFMYSEEYYKKDKDDIMKELDINFRPITQLSSHNLLLDMFETINEASEKTGESKQTISDSINGNYDKIYDYLWVSTADYYEELQEEEEGVDVCFIEHYGNDYLVEQFLYGKIEETLDEYENVFE